MPQKFSIQDEDEIRKRNRRNRRNRMGVKQSLFSESKDDMNQLIFDKNNEQTVKPIEETGNIMSPHILNNNNDVENIVVKRTLLKRNNPNRNSLFLEKGVLSDYDNNSNNNKHANGLAIRADHRRKSSTKVSEEKGQVQKMKIKYIDDDAHEIEYGKHSSLAVNETYLRTKRNGINRKWPYFVGLIEEGPLKGIKRIRSDADTLYTKIGGKDLKFFSDKFSEFAGGAYDAEQLERCKAVLKKLLVDQDFQEDFTMDKNGMVIVQKDTKLGSRLNLFYMLVMGKLCDNLVEIDPEIWKSKEITDLYCKHLFYLSTLDNKTSRNSTDFYVYINYYFFKIFCFIYEKKKKKQKQKINLK